MIEAELPDGTVLEFPDGTADSVIDGVVKQHLGVAKPSAPTPSASTPDPTSESSFWDYVPVVSTLRDIRDVYQQGFGPGFTMPKSVGERSERRQATDRVATDLVSAVTGGGAGVALAGKTLSAAAPKAAQLGARMLGSGLGMATADAGVQAVHDLTIDPKQVATAGALGALGQGVGEGIVAAGRGAKALLRGGSDPAVMRSAIDDLGRFGATPSLAQATHSPFIDSAESLVAKVPGGAGHIRKAAERTSDAIGKGIVETSDRLAAGVKPTSTNAGVAIQSGVRQWTKGFQKAAGAEFDKIRNFVPSSAPVPLTNTSTTLRNLIDPVPGAENTSEALVNPVMRKLGESILADLQKYGGAMPLEAALRTRSTVGRKLADAALVADMPKGEVKQLYKALSQDLEAAARSAGPDAVKTFERANRLYSKGMARIENLLEPIVKNKVPARVFKALESSGKDGETVINAVMKSLSPEQQRLVAATTIRRLGKAVPSHQGAEGGEFSFNSFLTRWNQLDEGGKAALFDRSAMLGVRQDLDAIARASGRIRESSKAFANPPGTAASTIAGTAMFVGAGSVLTGNLQYPMMLAMGGVSANAAARLMTSPRFIKWLATSTKMNPTGLPAHVSSLISIANKEDEDTQDAVLELLGKIGVPGADSAEIPAVEPDVAQPMSAPVAPQMQQPPGTEPAAGPVPPVPAPTEPPAASTPEPAPQPSTSPMIPLGDPDTLSSLWLRSSGNNELRRAIRRDAWSGLTEPTGAAVREWTQANERGLRAIYPPDHLKRVSLLADGMALADGSGQVAKPSRQSVHLAQFADWLGKQNPEGAAVLMKEALANPQVAVAITESLAVKAPKPGASRLEQFATKKLLDHMSRLGIVAGAQLMAAAQNQKASGYAP